jgi:glycosyltransferase involved in cell wall biosynthesis
MLSIAIPTMNRWSFLKDSLPLMLEQELVKEIVVCDENGNDIEAIQNSPFYSNAKLKLFKNEKRLGIYENKCKAASLCSGDWIAILDSDNFFPEEWFYEIEECIKKGLSKRIFASASFKSINIETGTTEYPCEQFDGLVLDKTSWNSFFSRPKWNFLLNDGNWVIPREAVEYLPKTIQSHQLLAADAIFMLRCWIQAGYSIEYVKGLSYIHTVHSKSSWIETAAESSRILGQRWDI